MSSIPKIYYDIVNLHNSVPKTIIQKKSEYKKYKNGDKYNNKDKKIIVDKVPVNICSSSAHHEQHQPIGPTGYSFSLNPIHHQPAF